MKEIFFLCFPWIHLSRLLWAPINSVINTTIINIFLQPQSILTLVEEKTSLSWIQVVQFPMVVVDAAGVSQVLLLERISHLSRCYPTAALKPFFIIFHASWRPHSAFLCAAPSSPPLHLFPGFPSSLLFSLNIIAHHFFSLFFGQILECSCFECPCERLRVREISGSCMAISPRRVCASSD